jgi:TonB-like protein
MCVYDTVAINRDDCPSVCEETKLALNFVLRVHGKDRGTMDGSQKMDVGDWQDSPRPNVPKIRAPRRFLPPALIGVLGTLLLHAMLIQSVSFASRASKPRPETQESALSESTRGADALVLISLPTLANTSNASSESVTSSLHDLTKLKIKPRISTDPPEFLNIETLALSEEQASNAIANDADGRELARLFGIYTGQIQARIDRVWRRPRTPVTEDRGSPSASDAGDSFQCEVQIVQDARGNVQEILLPRCNGSAAWKRSLVLAVQQASPLPAPPSIKVFTQSITLEFVGLQYIQGAPNEEYEIAPLARADQ